MKKIAITHPYFFKEESDAIIRCLSIDGFDRVHIRKPDASAQDVMHLIKGIPQSLYPKISIHYHFEIAQQLGLGGVHLNSKNCVAPQGWNGLISQSLHSLEEVASFRYDYAFLSPIYPSISKPGYKGNFDFSQLRRCVNKKIFALGGVTPEKFNEIETLGFGGAAMLGAVWKPNFSTNQFRLQFITHPSQDMPAIDQVERALNGGCKWIQLRHKDADIKSLSHEASIIRNMCVNSGAIFILDDHVELVHHARADGVHLGKNDIPVKEARALLGPTKIIGATANTFEDIVDAQEAGADYIGLGPFKFTTTKAKLSPILGLAGNQNIVKMCRECGIRIPIVAIGGIVADDIVPIMSTGVNGVAISGTIINAHNPTYKTKEIINLLNTADKCQN